MKRMVLVPTIATLLLAAPAFAGNGHGPGKGKGPKGGQDSHAAMAMPAAHGGDWKAEGRHDNGLHLGQKKQMWARGQRLPGAYLDQRYYIRDYHQYNLVAPPPGMVWVRPYQDDRRFYLVQAATGIISRIFGG